MSELIVRNLKKSFGQETVIHDLSFEVSEGEFCILLGPSGCGKSTILRLIAGLEMQDEGEIIIGGNEVSGLTPRERDVAMVFQSYALYPHMSAFENIAFPLRLRKTPEDEVRGRVIEIAELLDMQQMLQKKPSELSGGQRQRVALGRAIVRKPKLFLFDEPLSNLDAKLRSAMRIELAKLHQKLKTTMIYVTHDQVEAMTLGERIILLEEGRVMQTGTPRELYQSPENLFSAMFMGSPPINLVDGKIFVEGADVFFRSAGFILELKGRDSSKLYDGLDVTIGIRPEALSPGEGPIRGAIELVEHVGAEAYVYVAVPGIGTRIAAKVPTDFHGKRGMEMPLLVDTRALHFFREGKRIAP